MSATKTPVAALCFGMKTASQQQRPHAKQTAAVTGTISVETEHVNPPKIAQTVLKTVGNARKTRIVARDLLSQDVLEIPPVMPAYAHSTQTVAQPPGTRPASIWSTPPVRTPAPATERKASAEMEPVTERRAVPHAPRTVEAVRPAEMASAEPQKAASHAQQTVEAVRPVETASAKPQKAVPHALWTAVSVEGPARVAPSLNPLPQAVQQTPHVKPVSAS